MAVGTGGATSSMRCRCRVSWVWSSLPALHVGEAPFATAIACGIELEAKRQKRRAGRRCQRAVQSGCAGAHVMHQCPQTPTQGARLSPAPCSVAMSTCASALTGHPVCTHALRRLCLVYGGRLHACGRQDGRQRCHGRRLALRNSLHRVRCIGRAKCRANAVMSVRMCALNVYV